MRSTVRHQHYANDWRRWFAWYPVRIGVADGFVWVWWEYVERRTLCMGTSQGVYCWHEHALPEQVMVERCA